MNFGLKPWKFKKRRSQYMKWIKNDNPELYKYIRHQEYLGRTLTRLENGT